MARCFAETLCVFENLDTECYLPRCYYGSAMLEDMQLSSNMAAVETIKKITVMEGENAQFSI